MANTYHRQQGTILYNVPVPPSNSRSPAPADISRAKENNVGQTSHHLATSYTARAAVWHIPRTWYLVIGDLERIYEARAPTPDLVAIALSHSRAAAADATRAAQVLRRQEAVRRPEGERHVLQRERQQARRVLRVLPRDGGHVDVAVEGPAEKAVQVTVYLRDRQQASL